MKVAEIQSLLQKLGLSPNKGLGQNFLVSESVIQKIIIEAQSFNSERIIEVGPGLGSITHDLNKVKNKDLTLIELDRGLCEYWRGLKFNVIEKDALHVDWEKLVAQDSVVLVSNLPYQISASIVVDRSLDSKLLDGMVLMFQKEVAQKISAKVGDEDFGFISVIAQLAWSISKVTDAQPNDFWPPPKIASRVLSFRSKNTDSELRARVFKVTKAGFKQPRKYLLSNLEKGLAVPKATLQEIFNDQKIDVKERAEMLSLDQWLGLESQLRVRGF